MLRSQKSSRKRRTKHLRLNPLNGLSDFHQTLFEKILADPDNNGEIDARKTYSCADESGKLNYFIKFTTNMRINYIDPARLDELDAMRLKRFFSLSGVVFYHKDHYYPHAYNEEINLLNLIKFNRHILQRPANPSGKYSGQYRYEVFGSHQSKPIGRGTYGEVHEVICTLQPVKGGFISKQKHNEKQRVVKASIPEIENQSYNSSREEFLSCQKESNILSLIPHMHAKPVVFSDSQAFIVMRRMPGKPLKHILIYDRIGLARFSSIDRIQLSIAILEALRKQVHKYNVIHIDFKPNNIIVNLDVKPFAVNIVDFGSALYPGEDCERRAYEDIAQMPFLAPEVRAHYQAIETPKIDVYSAARVISCIFGCNLLEEAKKPKAFSSSLWAEATDGFYLEGLFNGIDDLSLTGKNEIRKLLKQMGSSDLVKRSSLDAAIDKLRKIEKNELILNKYSLQNQVSALTNR